MTPVFTISFIAFHILSPLFNRSLGPESESTPESLGLIRSVLTSPGTIDEYNVDASLQEPTYEVRLSPPPIHEEMAYGGRCHLTGEQKIENMSTKKHSPIKEPNILRIHV